MIFINNKHILLTNLSKSDEKQFNTLIDLKTELLCRLLLQWGFSVFGKSVFALTGCLRFLNWLGWEAFIHTESFSTYHVDGFFLHALGNIFVSYRARYTWWYTVAKICIDLFKAKGAQTGTVRCPNLVSHMCPRHTIRTKPINTYLIWPWHTKSYMFNIKLSTIFYT